MNDWTQWIRAELLVLIPVLYFIGKGLKKSAVKDKFIPLLLGGAGVLLSVLYTFSTHSFSTWEQAAGGLFSAFTQGVLTAGGSVYCDQLIKQSRKEN